MHRLRRPRAEYHGRKGSIRAEKLELELVGRPVFAQGTPGQVVQFGSLLVAGALCEILLCDTVHSGGVGRLLRSESLRVEVETCQPRFQSRVHPWIILGWACIV